MLLCAVTCCVGFAGNKYTHLKKIKAASRPLTLVTVILQRRVPARKTSTLLHPCGGPPPQVSGLGSLLFSGSSW